MQYTLEESAIINLLVGSHLSSNKLSLGNLILTVSPRTAKIPDISRHIIVRSILHPTITTRNAPVTGGIRGDLGWGVTGENWHGKIVCKIYRWIPKSPGKSVCKSVQIIGGFFPSKIRRTRRSPQSLPSSQSHSSLSGSHEALTKTKPHCLSHLLVTAAPPSPPVLRRLQELPRLRRVLRRPPGAPSCRPNLRRRRLSQLRRRRPAEALPRHSPAYKEPHCLSHLLVTTAPPSPPVLRRLQELPRVRPVLRRPPGAPSRHPVLRRRRLSQLRHRRPAEALPRHSPTYKGYGTGINGNEVHSSVDDGSMLQKDSDDYHLLVYHFGYASSSEDLQFPTENGRKHLSEEEMKLKTRREIAALGMQLGKMNIAAWASNDEEEKKQSAARDANAEEHERIEFEKHAAQWEEAEKSKHTAKVEQMKAQTHAKMVKKIALARQRSKEKCAAAAARKNREAERTVAQAEYIRQTGRMSPSSYICCGWL
ncbi:hypothetical protein PIB30_039406 [Stylosanthes scabra]|uniref:Remorin C-terminal domain-containing protein n=1 Tax=Stylosanthes scabra TaxID=79078 RepID=A0ABU6QEL9_9FABA|nr:hypothetical protein [Stylosanthes scabra]